MPVSYWEAPVTTRTGIDNRSNGSRLVQVANGDFWIVWQDFSNTISPENGADIFGLRFNALGVAQGGPARLNNNFSANNEMEPALAQEVGGTGFFMAYAVGLTPPSGAYQNLYIEKKNADGSANGGSSGILPIVIDTAGDTSGYNYENPSLAIASATNGLATYRRVTTSGSPAGTYGQFFNPATMQLIGTAFALGASAGVDPLANGNYVILSSASRSGRIIDQTGAQIGQPFYLTEDVPGPGSFQGASLTALVNGGFVVASSIFINDTGGFLTDTKILIESFASDGTFLASREIDPFGSNAWAFGPVLAPTADGGFLLHFLGNVNAGGFYYFSADLSTGASMADEFRAGAGRTMVGLSDGRVVMAETTPEGEIEVTIVDVRSSAGGTRFYDPNSRQIGTVFADVFSTDPAGVAFVNGHDGNDTITEGLGVDGSIAGDDGNDTIILTGADNWEASADGGAGTDKLVLTNLFATTTVNLQAGTLVSNSQNAAVVNFENFEAMGAVPVNVTGTSGANIITTGSGADTLDGGGGGDTLNGGGGADQMTGGAGDDFFFVDQAGDQVFEAAGQGIDQVLAAASWALAAGQHVEYLSTTIHNGTATINLTGNALSQTIYGNAGANILDGNGGGDVMIDFGGNDFFFVRHASDLVYEFSGGGTDQVLAAVSWTLNAGSYVEYLSTTNHSSTEAINLTGNELGQTIYGNAGANWLDGGGGGDVMLGRSGNDFYFVRNASDLVYDDAGDGAADQVFAGVNWTMNAGAQIEYLSTTNHSSTQAINLKGNEFNQHVLGNEGANRIDGGAGADILEGRGGADIFAFTTALGGGNIDTIVDFTLGTDKLGFAGVSQAQLGTGGAFRLGATAQDANDRIMYDPATGRLFYDGDGNGAGAAVQFATIAANLNLSASDFVTI